MKTEDTFSLTSIKEERPKGLKTAVNPQRVKLPHIKSQLSFRAGGKNSKNLLTPSTSIPNMKRNNSNSVTHDLLKSITERASQEINDIFKSKTEDLLDTVKTLEKSKHVKTLIKDLHSHVMKKKSDFNNCIHTKLALKSDILLMEQKLADLTAPEKVDVEKEKKLESLAEQLEELQRKITEESLYSECLEHMADIRKQNLDAVEDPTRNLRKKILHANITNQTLDREAEHHVTVARSVKFRLAKLQETINSQRESMRETLNQELAKYEERCKAVAFYRQSQQTWHKRKELETKTAEIRDLESIETELIKEQSLMKELETAQHVTAVKEVKIAEALKNTNSHSLSDLNIQLIQLKKTKESLINLQSDLEQRILRQKQEITYLNSQYQKVTLSQIEKEEFGYHTLYSLESKLALQESSLSNQEITHSKMKEICSASLLGLNRLIQKVGIAEEGRNFRSVKEAIDYLCEAIK